MIPIIIAGIIIVAFLGWYLHTTYATDDVVKTMDVVPTPIPCIPTPIPDESPYVPPDEIECIVIDYGTLYYTDTNIENVQEFLNAMPECDWCSACGSYSRYTYLEANKKGLMIGAITLIDPDQERIKAMMLSGHRMNYFESDGETYYIDNTLMHRKILRRHEIPAFIHDTYGIDIVSIAFKDTKKP